jgi:hypothetical protein
MPAIKAEAEIRVHSSPVDPVVEFPGGNENSTIASQSRSMLGASQRIADGANGLWSNRRPPLALVTNRNASRSAHHSSRGVEVRLEMECPISVHDELPRSNAVSGPADQPLAWRCLASMAALPRGKFSVSSDTTDVRPLASLGQL